MAGTWWKRWALLVSASLALGVGVVACKGGPLENDEEEGGRKLEPLPPAPTVKIEQEALPGADGKLAVVAARPTGEAQGNVFPTITFSKPMVALGTVEEMAKLAPPAQLDPAVPGAWRWLGSASVEFVPDGPLPYATPYKVTVPAGIRALDGSTLEQPYQYEFSTPRPVVQSVKPPPGFRWLAATPTFEILFNQPVKDPAAHVWLEIAGSNVPLVLGKVTRIADELRATEQGRRYPRMDQNADRFRNEQTRYEFKPAAPLPLDTDMVLVIDGAIEGEQGPLAMGDTLRHDFRTYGPMRVLGLNKCLWGGADAECPWGPLVILTSNRAQVESLKGKIQTDPPVEIDWDNVDSNLPQGWTSITEPYLLVPGKWRPGTVYKIKLAPGILDEFGGSSPAFEGEVRFDDRRPDWNAGPSVALLESAGDASLPIETVNLDGLAVDLWGLDASGLARALATDRAPPGPATKSFTLDTRATKNRTRWTPLEVRQAFGGGRSGFFATRIGSSAIPQRAPDVVIGQVTDLAVHAKLGATSGVLWVTSLSAGLPVGDAQVSILDRDGATKWTGKTDAQGIARVPGLAELVPKEDEAYRWEAPFALAVAEKNGEIGATLSSWMDGLAPSAFDLPMEWDGREPKSFGLVFADRGIYRPGDTVFLKGLVRYRRLGELSRPKAGSKAKLVVRTSRGDEVAKLEAEITSFGTFASEVKIPADAPLGTWLVEATVPVEGDTIRAGGDFRVEEYRPPQFQVDVRMRQPEAIAGEALQGTVLARYLFGGAMADADVRWTVTRSTTEFMPPGNEGFRFGANTWWWDDEAPVPSTEVAGAGDGKVDAQGSLVIDLGKADAPAGKTWQYTLEAEVSDVNRQRLANRASTTVHPAAYYAGVRMASTGFAETGKASRIELIAVDPAGQRVEGAKIAVSVSLRSWKSIRKKGAGGEWFTVSEPEEKEVATCDVRSARTPASCSVTPTEPGFYVIAATVTDGQGRTQTTRDSFYAVGQGWVSWQRNDTDRIDLVADKSSYEPGDTAKILVKSPYPEAEALLTVERAGVTEARRVKLTGAATTLEVPVDEAAIPNVFVGVILVRGRVAEGGIENGEDPGRPAVRVGYTQLKVEKRSKRLTVELQPDAPEKRPRDKVRVKLKVKDWQGRGAPAELTVWAVDEGVLRLTGYEAPDPVEAIYPLRGLSVRLGEPLLHLVQRRLYGEKGQTAGGGGGDGSGAGFRTRFQTTVLFAPTVMADANGDATVEFEVPDNLTTWRIMAVAVSADDRFGAGRSEVKVAKPLLALPALPRVARVGDRFEAGVVVHTHRFEAPKVLVTAQAEGLKLEGDAEKTVTLEGGKPQEVRFRFVAEAPGTAVLRFRVQGGGENDGVESRIPVKLPVAMEAVAVYGETEGEKAEALAPPAGVRPDVGGLEVTMASTALGGYDENMRQLVEYPYGCLEQMSSRLVPFVSLRELSGIFGVPWSPDVAEDWIGASALATRGSTDPDEVVKSTIREIERLQNVDGGYRYWASSPCSAQYASAMAVWALGRAKAVGYPVDAEGLARGQAYLADTVAAGKCERCGWGCSKPDDATRVFALYALARTGAPRASYYGEFYERRKQLPLFGKAMLADAMFVGGGDRAQAKTLLAEIMNAARETPSEVHFQETDPRTYAALWSSDTRTTALVLETLVDISPDHPFVPKIARYLNRVRDESGRYRNTQEAAFSLVALTELVRVKEKEVPDFTARVLLAGNELVSNRFQGRSMKVAEDQVPMSRVSGGGSLVFSKDGPGRLYYGARLRYAPKEMPTDPLDRGFTVQRWFEPYEGGGQTREFFAGELVRVRVRIASPMERHFAAIEVPLPAGLEAVDTSLASTAGLPHGPRDEGPGPGYEYESAEDLYGAGDVEGEGYEEEGSEDEAEDFSFFARSFYSPFNHTEQRDDRVVIFADRLPPGVHVASFVARATTPGSFVLQPAHAEEMYAPEVFGRSDGGRLEVRIGAPVAER